MAFLKPQNPMTKGSDYFYPLTTADQVIMDGGYRLNDIVGKVKKSTITLYANGWSVEVPHCYSVIVDGLSNNTDMKILPRFPEDFESKQIMREETAKISFASRNNNILTFECWDEIPTIDIPIDIEINILYPSMPDINLNYSIIGGTTEPENPSENMIWVNTENEITSHKLSKYEPKNPVEGMVWIYLGDASNVHFHTLSMNERELDEVYPLSVKQYVSGAWADKTAKSYQGGAWADWVTYLYKNGDECLKLTGGWALSSNVERNSNPTLVKNATSMTFSTSFVTESHFADGFLRCNNKIDLTEKSTITVFLESANISTVGMRLCISKTDSSIAHVYAAAGAAISNNAKVVSLDVSEMTGTYYVGICAITPNEAATSTVTVAAIAFK